ncbi:SDR family oxidoreductase [Cereibacter azotoformans]|uniref:2-keto-3-deoxy-L-fuconate dehydrogenase n=2 Tax=Cereibacter TaxID=1653176 RepID=A0A2T5KA45_9RHOB|nr:SDR family oxidoreductase [Cereibacter azotoformans]AXQ95286.1 SDR family oxidoreductase [Cereibacter sphaeroides]PTR19286.1 2-keto-3-deoxy-L-fuconate dehydrogenase [Cereibacter azotoformans]UIJ32493.1 SDR family oxidoreductase [Cereibacter azotoformans]ULB11594.1 SDR family oxidoreductase [Cereibacter azotoformans]
MSGRLAGKRAFVAGAGQGMGREIALAYAREGAEVIAASRTLAKMVDLPSLAPAIRPVELDLVDAEAVARVTGEAGPVDILVNCAAFVHTGTLLDCPPEDWRRSFDQNVHSCYHTIRGLLPGMLERGSGSIVNIASVASSITGVPLRAAYGTSKAALIGLTKAVARDFIGRGIRCNALCPGTTQSPSLQERIEATDDPEETRRLFVARQPMGRLGTVEEMAAAAIYLGSDESGFMTGQLLVVDGGQTL